MPELPDIFVLAHSMDNASFSSAEAQIFCIRKSRKKDKYTKEHDSSWLV